MKRKLAFFLVFALVAAFIVSPLSDAKKPIPPEPEEEYGNNLSVPVIFAEGIGLTGYNIAESTGLRSTTESLTEPFVVDGINYYLQQTVNTWCADFRRGSELAKEAIRLDWADNLVRQTWSANSVIRVENVMFIDNPNPAMIGYDMAYLGGEGQDEIWGTTGTTTESAIATAFSATARLKIEKLTGTDPLDAHGEPIVGLAPLFDAAIYEGYGLDGNLPDKYSAEINVGGKVIYGYNWNLGQYTLPEEFLTYGKAGWYRLTFSIDDQGEYDLVTEEGSPSDHYLVSGNVQIESLDEPDLGDLALYKPTKDVDGKMSILEIYIKPAKGGKK
jgi:hypothetical protein